MTDLPIAIYKKINQHGAFHPVGHSCLEPDVLQFFGEKNLHIHDTKFS
ncbi:MAG: hypothetical protein AB3N16_09700 [Flavobacteriaceae bacterium]